MFRLFERLETAEKQQRDAAAKKQALVDKKDKKGGSADVSKGDGSRKPKVGVALPEWASTHPTHSHRCEDIADDFLSEALQERQRCGCAKIHGGFARTVQRKAV